MTPKKKRKRGPPLYWMQLSEDKKIDHVDLVYHQCKGIATKAISKLQIAKSTFYEYRKKFEVRKTEMDVHKGKKSNQRPDDGVDYDAYPQLAKMLKTCEILFYKQVKLKKDDQAIKYFREFYHGIMADAAIRKKIMEMDELEARANELKFLESPDYNEFMDALKVVVKKIEKAFDMDEDLFELVMDGLESYVEKLTQLTEVKDGKGKVIEAEFKEVKTNEKG